MKYSFSLLIALLLIGCTRPIQSTDLATCFNKVEVKNGQLIRIYCNDDKDWREFKNDIFSIQIPGTLFAFTNNQIAFTSNPDNKAPQNTDFFVDIFNLKNTDCTDQFIGIIDEQKISIPENNSIWGRVDPISSLEWSIEKDGDQIIQCNYGSLPKAYSVYGMCSQNQKDATITCIRQMKDNRILAKQIFESFRWTN